MSNNLGEQIRECYRHAENCAEKAAALTDEELKRDFLELERQWLLLARSFELNGQLTDFSARDVGLWARMVRQMAVVRTMGE